MGGNGGIFSSLFGGGYEAPEPVKYESAPQQERNGDPEAQATRDAERKRNRARAGGVKSTLLSNPLGGGASTLGGTAPASGGGMSLIG